MVHVNLAALRGGTFPPLLLQKCIVNKRASSSTLRDSGCMVSKSSPPLTVVLSIVITILCLYKTAQHRKHSLAKRPNSYPLLVGPAARQVCFLYGSIVRLCLKSPHTLILIASL